MTVNRIKRFIKIFIATACTVAVSCQAFACKRTINMKQSEIDICADEIRNYLDAKTAQDQFTALANAMGSQLDRQYASIEYSSENGKTYRVFAFNVNDDNERFVVRGRGGKATGGLFIPGETYRLKIVGMSDYDEDFFNATAWKNQYSDYVTEEKTVKIKDSPVRFITLNSGYNYRDLGGWETETGKKICYGKIYRGARTNGFSEKDIAIFKENLHIKSEIDLRNSNDDGGQNSSILGDDINYLKAPMSQYSYILPSFSLNGRTFDTNSPAEIKRIFEFLADEHNYPLFFHCNAGADRTGTLAFLILGSLGVTIGDLTRDFELTSFSQGGTRLRGKFQEPFEYGIMQDDANNFVAWGDMISRIKSDYPTPDGKLSSSIKKYLTTECKISAEILSKMADILLSK